MCSDNNSASVYSALAMEFGKHRGTLHKMHLQAKERGSISIADIGQLFWIDQCPAIRVQPLDD